MQHTFLGWEKPCLQAVSDLLISRHRHGRYVDLSNLVLVFPSRVASRRLLTLLAQEAYNHELTVEPPRVKTTGDFPELLYSQKFPFASSFAQQVVWMRALQRCAKEQKLAPVIPYPPQPGDTPAWLELGREISAIQQELAADGLDFTAVLEKWDELHREGVSLPVKERRRWEVLQRVQKMYHAILDEMRLWDKQSARLYALKNAHPQRDFNIRFQLAMVGCVDLNRIQQQMLQRVAANVEIFTFAPQAQAERFNDMGCLLPEKWQEPVVEIPDEAICQVTNPEDQARAVTEWLRSLGGECAADEISVGVLDDSLVPYITQQLRLEGVTSHYGGGTQLSALGPWRLLEAMTNWLDDHRYTHFAALVRHPDMERYLRDVCEIPMNWVEELDKFYYRHLPEFIHPTKTVEVAEAADLADTQEASGDFFFEEEAAAAATQFTPDATPQEVGQAFSEQIAHSEQTAETSDFLPAFRKTLAELSAIRDQLLKSANYHNAVNIARNNGIRNTKYAAFASIVSAENLEMETHMASMPVWGCCVVDFLLKIYGWRIFNANLETDHQTARSCLDIRRTLIEEMQLPQRLTPKIRFVDGLRLFLSQTADNRLTPLGLMDAVDLRGWLELPLDDTSATILTGFNEGIIPQARNGHAFLPNRLREALGIETNETRFARDMYILTVLLATRKKMKIVFGRLSADGSPMMPSRLLLTGDDQTLARRAKAFFSEPEDSPEAAQSPVFAQTAYVQTQAETGITSETGAGTVILREAHVRTEMMPPRGLYTVPPPEIPETPKTRMSVSEFNDYLACPYRYYLKHIQKLTSVEDQAGEMDGGQFGNLAHEILKHFGSAEITARQSGERPWRDTLEAEAERIIHLLDELLDDTFSRHYGKNTISTLFIQKEQLRDRLHRFARQQAHRTLDGWEIRYVETRENVLFRENGGAGDLLQFPGGPMTIHGVLDRVDYHPASDTWDILDYKTSDAGRSPEEVHHTHSLEKLCKRGIPLTPDRWVNLQLPLYRQLASSLLDRRDAHFRLGYVLLPKDPGKTGFRMAGWEPEHLRSADEIAESVICRVRAADFRRSDEKPAYEDEFTWIMKE